MQLGLFAVMMVSILTIPPLLEQILKRYREPDQLEFGFIRQERVKFRPWLTVRDETGVLVLVLIIWGIVSMMIESSNDPALSVEAMRYQKVPTNPSTFIRMEHITED